MFVVKSRRGARTLPSPPRPRPRPPRSACTSRSETQNSCGRSSCSSSCPWTSSQSPWRPSPLYQSSWVWTVPIRPDYTTITSNQIQTLIKLEKMFRDKNPQSRLRDFPKVTLRIIICIMNQTTQEHRLMWSDNGVLLIIFKPFIFFILIKPTLKKTTHQPKWSSL